jgi:hypothetical protein
MATLQNLQARAADWRNAQRQRIHERQGVTGVGNGWMNPLGISQVMNPLNIAAYQQPGGMNLPRGVTPSEFDVDREIAMGGGNPITNRMQAQSAAIARQVAARRAAQGRQTAEAEPTTTAEQDLIARTFAALNADRESANNANLARYDEGHGELSGLRQRNQDRVANWGIAAEDDLEERAKESLGNQMAMLASRGLSNSTITPAFAQRNSRDLAREIQRVSEMRDSRAVDADTRDTGNLVGFVERREDTAAPMEFMANLALQHAQAGDNAREEALIDELRQARRKLSQRGKRSRSGGQRIGFSPWQAQMLQNSIGNLGLPQGGLPGMLLGGRGPITSNRYPFNRHSVAGEQAAIEAAVDAAHQPIENRILSQPRRRRRNIGLNDGAMYA